MGCGGEMKLVTRQELANGVARRWKEIYCDQGRWSMREDAEAIFV